MIHRIRTPLIILALGLTAPIWTTWTAAASEGVDDVIKLSHATVGQDIMLAYVQTSTTAYELSADEIQKLRDAGVSATVIVAMLDHGKELRGGGAATSAPAAPVGAPAANSNDPAAVPISQPQSDEPQLTAAPPDATNASATTVVAPPEQDMNISFFYEAMAPHGRWHQTSLGWAWQPSAVEVGADWRPYANGGHWVWSDHGWYWESSYPWGWAAFHYGRWSHDAGLGWVWIPDTTWGPAWVSWRQGDAYYGWAPLPPETRLEAGVGFSFHSKHVGFSFDFGLAENDWAFVPSERFLEPELSVAIVAPSHARNVYRQTTIVNNTYVYNDNRVINNGVPVSQVAARTSRTIDTVRIADARVTAGAPIRGEVRSRDTITVFRPAVATATPRDPNAVAAHSLYVRRVAPAYPTVTSVSERDAQRRLSVELSQRHTPAPTSVAPPAAARSERDDAAQRRLDAELAARERSEHGKPAKAAPAPNTSHDGRAINEPIADRGAADRHDDKHSDKNDKGDKSDKGDKGDKKDKHHHGDE